MFHHKFSLLLYVCGVIIIGVEVGRRLMSVEDLLMPTPVGNYLVFVSFVGLALVLAWVVLTIYDVFSGVSSEKGSSG